MVPSQEANGDNLEIFFQFSTQYLYEAILISTHNIQFHAKIRKKKLFS